MVCSSFGYQGFNAKEWTRKMVENKNIYFLKFDWINLYIFKTEIPPLSSVVTTERHFKENLIRIKSFKLKNLQFFVLFGCNQQFIIKKSLNVVINFFLRIRAQLRCSGENPNQN